MPTFKITLAYDGTDFVGWQRQAAGTSIQGLLEDAVRELDAREVTVAGAGRTDAGVHALGQVASFALERAIEGDVLMRALNARLPDPVRVWSAQQVPPAFHARFDARAKSYRHRICTGAIMSPFERRYAWHVAGALDPGAMSDAARRLEGRHDFAAFQGAGSEVSTTERTIMTSRVLVVTTEDAEGQPCSGRRADPDPPLTAFCAIEGAEKRERATQLDTGFDVRDLPPSLKLRRATVASREGGRVLGGSHLITYEITGDGFLRHMVRNIVGTLVEIGLGRRTPEWIDTVLASRDRSAAGPTAPARGLFLTRVHYGALATEP
jgi:tRNA pseudouridine38-40 synthase